MTKTAKKTIKKAVPKAPLRDLKSANACVKSCVPIALVGEKGTGKTSFAKMLADSCKKALVVFSCNSQTSKEDITGRVELDGGRTRFEKSAVIQALEKGDFVLLDEVNTSLPEVLSVLQSLAETSEGSLGEIHIPALGKSVNPDKSARLFIAYNENYEGTTELNEAFLSRFARLNFEYPTTKEVQARLQEICSKSEAVEISAFADCINAAMVQTNSRYRVSMRECIQCARLLTQGLQLQQTLECTMLNHLNENELEAVFQIAEAAKGNIKDLKTFCVKRLSTMKSSEDRLKVLEDEAEKKDEEISNLTEALKSQKMSREMASKKLSDLAGSKSKTRDTDDDEECEEEEKSDSKLDADKIKMLEAFAKTFTKK